MSSLRQEPMIRLPSNSPPKPSSKIGYLVGIIILIIVVVTLIVVIIVLLARRSKMIVPECKTNADCTGGKFCSSNVCVFCIGPPPIPAQVAINNTPLSGTATISWSTSTGATSYNVYRKIGDPSVSKSNFHQKENTTSTTRTFTSLPTGTHYFVVTSVNQCGESDESIPVLLAPSCSSFPTTMVAPTVVQSLNDCGGLTNVETVDISFPDMSIPDGVYIVEGTGQDGSVSPYTYLVQGSSWGPATGIALKCGGVASTHTVTQIIDVENATITVTGPVITGTSFNMTWNPNAGAEEAIVFVVGIDPVTSVPHFYGGYASGTANSLVVNTNNGDNLVFGIVLTYKKCNKSIASAPTPYLTVI